MLSILLTWVLAAFVLILTSAVVPGFKIVSFGSALIAVVVIGLLNAFLRPLLLILALPVNFLTLGLFTFVVNAVILRMASGLISGFRIDGWFPAICGAVVLALLNAAMQMLFYPRL